MVTDDFRCICMDFGISRLIDSDFKMTVIGTPVYMAPEVMNLEKYTEKADIYSFALVMNAMVILKTLFISDPFFIIKSSQEKFLIKI